MEDKIIKELLLAENYVSANDLDQAEKYAKSHQAPIVEYLLSKGLITYALLNQAIAEYYKLPYLDLSTNQPADQLVLKLPKEIALKYKVVIAKEAKAEFVVAVCAPLTDVVKQEITNALQGKKVKFVYAGSQEIEGVLNAYRPKLETRFGEIIKSGGKIAPEIIDQILLDALALRASDIHYEPREKETLVRFRVDGVLHEAGRIPKEYYENIVNRIKVQSRLRIDEHYASQDGAVHFEKEGMAADLRVSIVPTLDGEKVVIRILAEYVRNFSLNDIGLSPQDQETVVAAAYKPFGMILVTGPTGSGKTTTLYSLIKLLNDTEKNITTIEDPVEYKVLGVNQIQVNPLSGMTFAKGLRAISRQDPNIILVGEVRDSETADIAVNAALTGHLMLSTFHANDAAAVVPRLINMGIEPFLLASTLELIIAQRLVRRICDSCRMSTTVTVAGLQTTFPGASNYFPGKTVTLFQGKGCNVCSNTGYKGRVGLFEFIKVTPEMQDLIASSPSSRKIAELAKSQGSRSLFEDGMDKVKAGFTTIDELIRVVSPPEIRANISSKIKAV